MDTIVPGALAAFVVDCSIFPLDTVKSRVQAADYAQRYPDGRGLYRGLWQGFGPVVIATLPSAALFFTTYEHAKEALNSHSTPLLGPLIAKQDPRAVAAAHALSSAFAELAACLILTPAETIKQRRQVASPAGASSSSSTVRALGGLTPSALFRGYGALVSRNLPFTAMQFPLYEYFRGHLAEATGLRQRRGMQRAAHQGQPQHPDDIDASTRARHRAWQVQQRALSESQSSSKAASANDLPSAAISGDAGSAHYAKAGLVSGASAAGAGAISALITSPLDLVKTRIMLASPEVAEISRQASASTSPGLTKKSASSTSTQSILAVGRDIWRREGLPGLMRGAMLRSVWTALGAGIYLGSYEAGREWWGDAGKLQAQEAADRASELVQDIKTSS